MNSVKKFCIRLLYPSLFWVLLLPACSAVVLIYLFTSGQGEGVFAPIFYAIATYALVIVAVRIPALIEQIKGAIYQNRYGNKLIRDVSFRVETSLYLSLGFNLGYAAFKFFSGIYYHVLWLDAAAIYYVVLSIMRFLLLNNMRKRQRDLYKELMRYRSCGWLLCVLNVPLVAMVAQIVQEDRSVIYPGHLVYVVALYAFYSLTMAIVNLIRFRNLHEPLMFAAKAISFATALVAMLSLQITMIATFGKDFAQPALMNLLTGMSICIVILGMAVMMIIRSNRAIHDFENMMHKEER